MAELTTSDSDRPRAHTVLPPAPPPSGQPAARVPRVDAFGVAFTGQERCMLEIDLDGFILASQLASVFDNPRSSDPAARWSTRRARRWILRRRAALPGDARGQVCTRVSKLREMGLEDWADAIVERVTAVQARLSGIDSGLDAETDVGR